MHGLLLFAGSTVNLSPQAPPVVGQKLDLILHWLGFGIAAACGAAVAIQGARLAWTVRQGGVGIQEHGASLGWTLLGLIIVGAAGTIVSVLT